MELLKHIDAVISAFVAQNCLFSDMNHDAFQYRLKSISPHIPDDFILDMYNRLTANEILDKKNIRQISVSNSIKIVGMTKKFAALATPQQKIELICFLVFLSEHVLTFNRQVIEIIKVVSSILITREEDFTVIHEMIYTKKYPAVSDRAFTYLTSEPVSLDILLTQSNVIVLDRPYEIYGVYKLYSYDDLFLFWYRVKNASAKQVNVVNVYNSADLTRGFASGFGVTFDYDRIAGKKRVSTRINYPGSESEPAILLDEEQHVLRISGASMPFSAFEFYQPVIKWIDRIRAKKPTRFEFHLDLDFFDTQSSKMLLETMRKALELKEVGTVPEFIWYTTEDDEDMKEAGKEYATILNQHFRFISRQYDGTKYNKV